MTYTTVRVFERNDNTNVVLRKYLILHLTGVIIFSNNISINFQWILDESALHIFEKSLQFDKNTYEVQKYVYIHKRTSLLRSKVG